MYCANCGVKLADTEKRCPLCGTEAYHPSIERPEVDPPFPKDYLPKNEFGKTTLEVIILTLFLIAFSVPPYTDYIINGRITWSAYVAMSIVLTYIIIVLPTWFKKPTPAVFVPIDFLGIALLLHYVNYATEGDWFLSFAFPITLYLGLLVTSCSVLLFYLKKGRLYVIGAFFIALGVFINVIELFLTITFPFRFVGWSFCATIPLALLGLGIIIIAINKSARAVLARKLHF